MNSAETPETGADMEAACRLLGTDTVLAMAHAPGLLERGACDWRVVLLTLGTLQAELGLPRPQVVAAMYDWILRAPSTTHRPVADVCNISKNVRWLRRCAHPRVLACTTTRVSAGACVPRSVCCNMSAVGYSADGMGPSFRCVLTTVAVMADEVRQVG